MIFTENFCAMTICCVCGDRIFLPVNKKIWFHEDGTVYCCDLHRLNSYLSEVAQENEKTSQGT